MLNVITTSLPFILPLVVFPKALFSALYSSSCTLPLSILLSLPFPSTTTFTQMILSSSLSTHSTLTQAFLTFKMLLHISLPGWLLIFLLLTPLRLNSCSSDSKNNLPKIHNSSLDTSHSARNLGFIFDEHLTFSDQITALQSLLLSHLWTTLYTALPWFVNCLYHCYLYRSLQTWLL